MTFYNVLHCCNATAIINIVLACLDFNVNINFVSTNCCGGMVNGSVSTMV